MTYFFETYGCQMNSAESAAMQLELKNKDWTEAESAESADLVLLNTCSVRATAEQRVFGRLAHYEAQKKLRPFTLIVAGCMAQRLGASLMESFPSVDYVMGTASRVRFPLIVDAVSKGERYIETDEEPAFAFSSSHLEEGQFRSFLPIMHGCNNFCSYCIVPYVRGREISRSPESIREEIQLLAEKGVRELTLLGQNVNSYSYTEQGKRLGFPELLDLVAREVENTPIRWVRFLSSHPKDLGKEAIQVIADNPVYCRHIHLCVQHGSNRILKAMNRRYTREQYLDLVGQLRSALPSLTLSSDLLIGFPGETEQDFNETLTLMDEVRFQYAYMYYYNPREGTAAYSFPDQIPDEIKKERLARVIELQHEHIREHNQKRIGTKVIALVESISRKNADELLARTERDEMLVFKGPVSLVGSFIEAELSSLNGNTFKSGEWSQCLHY